MHKTLKLMHKICLKVKYDEICFKITSLPYSSLFLPQYNGVTHLPAGGEIESSDRNISGFKKTLF